MEAREELIKKVFNDLSTMDDLTNEVIKRVENSILLSIENFEVTPRTTELTIADSNEYEQVLKYFLATKRLEGRSDNTIKCYYDHLYKFLHTINKNVAEIITYDIRLYLANYQSQRGCSNRSLENVRACISSFFSFCHKEKIIHDNPMSSISKIQYEKKQKEAFSTWDLEKLRTSCPTIRDRAMIEFLYSTGCRVSEMCNCKVTNINFENRTVEVLGKGNKYRLVYLTEVCINYLQKYINEREYKGDALFVSLRRPFKPLQKNGVEARLKTIGKLADVDNVHPHRFRRTLATTLISKGVEIADVAQLLGHDDVRTTSIYINVDEHDVFYKHQKYIN